MTEAVKRWASFILRLVLSLGLMGWILTKVDFPHMLETLKGANLAWLAAALIVFVVTVFIILWRWRLLMKAVGIEVTRFECIKWFFIGQFCNLFLPSSVGGDVVKALGIASITGDKPKVFASVVLDRLSGFAGIALVAMLAFVSGKELLNDQGVVGAILGITAVSVVMACVLFSQRIFSWCLRLVSFWPKLKDSLHELHEDVMLLRRQKMKAIESVMLSIIAQIILSVSFYLTALAMNQSIDLMYFIIFSPIVCVVSALPSIGGLGVREIGWVYLLGKVGVSQSIALALSLMNFVFMLIIGLAGGVLYVATLSHRRV